MSSNSEPIAKPVSFSCYLLIAAAIYVFIQTFSILAPILLSFLLTLLISLALNPLVIWLRALTGGRKFATGLVTAALVTIVAMTCWAFLNPLKASFTSLSEVLPGYWERLQKPLIRMEKHAELAEEKLQAEIMTEISTTDIASGKFEVEQPLKEPISSNAQKKSPSIRSSLGEMFRGVVGSFTTVAFNGAQMLIVLVTVFFSVIFTLMNPRPIIGAIFLLVPDRYHGQTLSIMQRISRFAPAWLGSTLVGMLTIGLLVFMLMWPIFGFTDAVILGIIAGVFESVPFLGPTLSAVPALLLAFGKEGMTPFWVLLAYIAVQALENNIILPLIMARGMRLHAVAVIFSMLLCISAFGVLGVLVAAPLVAILIIVHDELFRKRFLSTITDADLDRLARMALHEKQIVSD